MTASQPVPDSFEQPSRDELVTFSVLCKPASGIGLDEFRRRLDLSSLDGLLPSETTLANVARRLRSLGFEVFDIPSPVVFARGTVDLFEKTFVDAQLVRLTRQVSSDGRRLHFESQVVLRPGTEVRTVHVVEGALAVTVAEPPRLGTLPTPPTSTTTTSAFCLRLPAGVAKTTKASSIHRRVTPTGDRATGTGVVVAVIDTGFAKHPFFNKYPQIKRVAAHDVKTAPEIDEAGHGTAVLANLLSCAPGANVYGIKKSYGDVAFADAMAIPGVRVISLSWGFDRASNLLPWMVVLEFLIVFAVVNMGVTVIVSSGNGTGETGPANRPEVISVGGVSVDGDESLQAWELTSSFRSNIHRGRSVPDLCGVASQIRLPMPPDGDDEPGYWWLCTDGGTSCATPQVAGIAALLIQKKPTLTPHDVRGALIHNGTDVIHGYTFTGDQADDGPDCATGGGLVNAVRAWSSVRV